MRPEDCRTVDGWTAKDFKLASDLLSSKYGNGNFSFIAMKNLTNISGCKVKYFPLKDQSKILGGTVTKVLPMSISRKKFSLEDPEGKKREISIYDYFVERYERSDIHRDGPCLELNSRNYVPAEVSLSIIFSCRLSNFCVNRSAKSKKDSPSIES